MTKTCSRAKGKVLTKVTTTVARTEAGGRTVTSSTSRTIETPGVGCKLPEPRPAGAIEVRQRAALLFLSVCFFLHASFLSCPLSRSLSLAPGPAGVWFGWRRRVPA